MTRDWLYIWLNHIAFLAILKMSEFLHHERTVSSPGKALVAGGYLVLEPQNIGITIGCTSRFFVTVTQLPIDNAGEGLAIVIESPQFHTKYNYRYNATTDSLKAESEQQNEFVEKCIQLTLSFIKEHRGAEQFVSILNEISSRGALGIKLRADNDFYSQIKVLEDRGLERSKTSLEALPKFIPCPVDSDGKVVVAKTGMGSSAAMTTSLVAAMLSWFGIIELNGSFTDLQIVHNLAQLAHAIAQGKIGSGFDVSSAVYGTQMYRRFSADKLSQCMCPACGSRVIYESVMDNSLWTQTVEMFSLPLSFDLLMGDVCGGSSSTSMAKMVLKWRNDCKEEATKIWEDLSSENAKTYECFLRLNNSSKEFPSEYAAFVQQASERPASEWTTIEDSNVKEIVLKLKEHFGNARRLLKLMGDRAGVEIEPDEQTQLANATEALPGVLCAGVPGAGGQDALFAIVVSQKGRENVEKMWSSWTSPSGVVVCPLLLQAEGQSVGVRLEESVHWD